MGIIRWFCKQHPRTKISALAFALYCFPLICDAQETNNGDTDKTLSAIVGVRAQIPPSARLADVLGTTREGSGIVIDDNGLILTIGYLILEASDVEVSDSNNNFVPAKVVAYDYDTGFGLVRSLQPIGIRGIDLGESDNIEVGSETLIISYVGPQYMRAVQVVDIREFPGYWEYLLENAIFTAPPFREFAGAALIDQKGRLVGVGSLIVGDASEDNSNTPGNMFVPIDQLKPILSELLEYGRRAGSGRPWLGVYTEMTRGHLFITRVAADSPAAQADLKENDIVINVNGTEVTDMAGFFRSIWSIGEPGVEIRISILRAGKIMTVNVKSEDRYDWLRLNPRSKYISRL